jgi:predicted Zn-dependent protease
LNKEFSIAIFVLLGIISCASTDVPSMGEVESLRLHEDEGRLWNRSSEEQTRLDHSSYIYDDPVLIAYVNNVAQNLIPEDLAEKGITIQVKIIKNPLLNAFAYPNGVIYMHTGILSKMENEAQLATILGHEMIHVTHRHAVQNYRSVKNTTAILATVQVAAVPFGAYGDLANILGTLGAMAAVTGYSRELETEADEEGLKLLVKAGYDPKEAPKIFEHLKRDVEEQDVKEPFFFGTHPRLKERINNYNKFIAARYENVEGKKGREEFMRKITPVLLANASLDIAMGRYGSAQRDIERFLQIDPQNAKAHYSLGELYRQKNEENDIENAIREYDLSVNYDPSYAAPHKSLGILYYKQGHPEKSKWEFERYLFLAPDAKDRKYIEQYIKELGQR